jgi:hypothetical protein
MKLKTLKLPIMLLVLAAAFYYCKQKEEPEEPDEPIIEEPCPLGEENINEVSLKGTKWKLAGVVEVETGNFRELVPYYCIWDFKPDCFTFEFDTDTYARGRVVVNVMSMHFNFSHTNGSIIPIYIGGTKDGDIGVEDVQICNNALWRVYSYSVNEDSLKLFFDRNLNRMKKYFKLSSLTE